VFPAENVMNCRIIVLINMLATLDIVLNVKMAGLLPTENVINCWNIVLAKGLTMME